LRENVLTPAGEDATNVLTAGRLVGAMGISDNSDNEQGNYFLEYFDFLNFSISSNFVFEIFVTFDFR